MTQLYLSLVPSSPRWSKYLDVAFNDILREEVEQRVELDRRAAGELAK